MKHKLNSLEFCTAGAMRKLLASLWIISLMVSVQTGSFSEGTKTEDLMSDGKDDYNSTLSQEEYIHEDLGFDHNDARLPIAAQVQNLQVEAVYNIEYHLIQLNITWRRPSGPNQPVSYDIQVLPNSSNCVHHNHFDTYDEDKDLTNILVPTGEQTNFEIKLGCSYRVKVTGQHHDGKNIPEVIYNVPDCVGPKCSCASFSPNPTELEVTPIYPTFLNISWLLGESNKRANNITKIIIRYRLHQKKPRPFIPNIFDDLYIANNTLSKSHGSIIYDFNGTLKTEELYDLSVFFYNNYTCYRKIDKEFTIRDMEWIKRTGIKQENFLLHIFLPVSTISIVMLLLLYYYRRNLTFIKNILFSLSARARSERRDRCYTIVKQEAISSIYVEQEIADGMMDHYEFPRARIKRHQEIGSGAFGQVYLATATNINGKPGNTMIALKALREGAPCEEIDDFKAEIEMLKKVGNHPNVVWMLGCCTLSEPYLMLMEYVPCGDLKNYLLGLREEWKYKKINPVSPTRTHTSDGSYIIPDSPISLVVSIPETEYTMLGSEGIHTPTTPTKNFNRMLEKALDHTELQNFALQIAYGMRHLEKIGITHRDLAARNILISENKTLKISDFGLSRSGPYIINNKSKKLPLRWMALESIQEHFYDNKSDVWSYAVVLWEIGTLGAFPYDHIPDTILIYFLKKGERLQRPEICTDELYALMLRCWSRDPRLRPSFYELVELLDVKKKRIYVDFSQLNPSYIFPPTEEDEPNNDCVAVNVA